jgi:hypothetical protein
VVTVVVELAVAEGVAVGIAAGVGELAAVFDRLGVTVGTGLARRVASGFGSVPGLGVGVGIGTGAASELVTVDDAAPPLDASAVDGVGVGLLAGRM